MKQPEFEQEEEEGTEEGRLFRFLGLLSGPAGFAATGGWAEVLIISMIEGIWRLRGSGGSGSLRAVFAFDFLMNKLVVTISVLAALALVIAVLMGGLQMPPVELSAVR